VRFALFFFASLLAAQQYDVLITGGRVVDGTGGPWITADLAIQGHTIVAMGRLRGAAATRVVDAKGMVVAPGFIDIHSHARSGVFITPSADNYIRQGVTTAIEGPDGGSPLPLAPPGHRSG
jgi:N-acyl-D-aspartate/D-glutamate deacylase